MAGRIYPGHAAAELTCPRNCGIVGGKAISQVGPDIGGLIMKGFTIGAALAALLPGPLPAKTAEPVSIANARSFKDVQSVVIGSFTIGFLTGKTDQATSGRRGLGGASAITRSSLTGMGMADFQAITDAAYADFTAKLIAAGYTIVDRTQLTSAPAMAKIRYQPSGTEGGVMFGKDGKARALFFGPTAFGAQSIMEGEADAGGTGIGGMGIAMAKNSYAIINKQPMINIAYIVDYASADRYGGAFAVGASVKVTAQLAIAERLSKMTVTDTKGMLGTAALGQPIAVGGAFGALRDSTTAGQKTGEAIGNLIGAFAGGDSSSRKSLTFAAAPEQYRSGAIDAAARANSTLISKVQTLR